MKRIFLLLSLLVMGIVTAHAQMEFTFGNLSGVKQVRLQDGTTLVQLPAGTDLTRMSTYGMSVKVNGASASLSDIVPNPSTQSYTDGALNSFYYNGRSYQVRFAAGEYFTAVFFTDTRMGSPAGGVDATKLATYAENITKMGTVNGRHFQFDALPGYNPTADIAFFLGDMKTGSSPTPVVRTMSNYSNVTRVCAVVFGQFESMGSNSTIQEYGLCYGTSANPTTSNTYKAAADYAESDDTFGDDLVGVFGVYFDNLTPQTTYHVRAYCKYKESGSNEVKTTYGEDITITTTAGSGFTWAWEGGETPDATVKARIEEAMDSAKYYYHNYCNLYKWCGTSYNSGVQTADCSLRSDNSCYIRFGPGERYQWVGTAQHEISHGYGIGQTGAFSGYANPFAFKIGTLTLRVFLRDMTMRIYHDGMHYWPGGINQREEVTNGTANDKGTYTCSNAEMLKCNALILNGFALDGMQTTYGWVKEENSDLDLDEGGALKSRRKVSASGGGTAFEIALDAFNQAGIPLLVSAGDIDQAHGTTGNNAAGYTLNEEAYAIATRALTEAQTHGVEDVSRFSATSLTNTVDPQPYAFKFKGVRFYNGLKFWFDKAMYKYSNSSYRYLSPDQTLSGLTTYVNNHKTETSIWMQHFPMSAADYLWLDKQDNSDAEGTVYRYDNGTTSYNNNTYNATYNQYNTAARRRSKLTTLVNQTAHAAMFTGHAGTYAENSANTFTDYTLDAMGNTPGDVLIVLMKAGTGVIEVKRVDFQDYGLIVNVTENEDADKPTTVTNKENVVLGGLVEAIENLGANDATLTAALNTAKAAKTTAAVTAAITSLDNAFQAYMNSTTQQVTGLLGPNYDFESAQGSRLSTDLGSETEGFFGIPGWTENHESNQTAWAMCQYQDASTSGSPVGSGNSLYMRENWKGSPAYPSTIQIYKDAVLPTGNYKLSFYMRQNAREYSDVLNYFEVDGTRTTFWGGWGWDPVTYDIAIEEPTIFRLSFGFKGSALEGNHACQVEVDGISLTWISEGAKVDEGTFYFYNQETQSYLTGGNDWGTRASRDHMGIDITLTEMGSGYSLETGVYNSTTAHYLGANPYMDQPAVAWLFEDKGTVGGKQTYALTVDGVNYLATEDASTIVTTTTNSDDPHAYWVLKSRVDMLAEMTKATEAKPVDATFLIPGFNFSRNDTRNDNWTHTDYTAHGGYNENMVIEYWNKNFDMYQQLTNIPNGIYELSCQGYYRNGGKDLTTGQSINAYLYANSETQAMPDILSAAGQNGTVGYQNANGYIPNSITDASSYLSAGLYWTTPLRVTVEDGTLKVGVKKETLVGDDWTVIDNFKLMYLGDGHVPLIGDIDNDGDKDFDDVTALVNYLTSKPGDYNLDVADVNEDGKIGIGDVTALINELSR